MHFDDRLATVLRLPSDGGAFARIQYRQLVYILGRLGEGATSRAVEDGFRRLLTLTHSLSVAERAGVLSEPMTRIDSPRLLAFLAEDEAPVAQAAFAAARLSAERWSALVPNLSPVARAQLRRRAAGDDHLAALVAEHSGTDEPDVWNGELDHYLIDEPGQRAAPQVAGASGDEAEPDASAVEPAADADRADGAPQPAGDAMRIAEIVRRIEAFRSSQPASAALPDAEPQPQPQPKPQPAPAAGETPSAPVDEPSPSARAAEPPALPPPASIDFATDSSGRIASADAPAAPSLVGLDLLAPPGRGAVRAEGTVARALADHQPVLAARISILGTPLVEGEWQLDAAPLFETGSGRYLGHAGRLRRPCPAGAAGAGEAAAPDSETDRMRQVLHELRTPANAIQVAAEIIQQQLYGPAPHEYRALAAAIAGDIAHVLAGFEEIDRLVKLESGALTLPQGRCDIAEVLAATIARLGTWLASRGSSLDVERGDAALEVPIAETEAERLVWRLLSALAGATARGENLAVAIAGSPETVRVAVTLPARLAAATGEETALEAPLTEAEEAVGPRFAGLFGLPFALRLAEAEAKAAGGRLERDQGSVALCLPRA